MLITAMLMATVLAGGEPDGVVATAPATSVDLGATLAPTTPSVEGAAQNAAPHGLDTDAQIDRWIAARAAGETPMDEGVAVWRDDRKPHGEVSFGIGTGGYRQYGASASLPIGENGRLNIEYRQVENGFPFYGYGGGYGLGRGYDPYFDDSWIFPRRRSLGAAYDYRVPRPDGASRPERVITD